MKKKLVPAVALLAAASCLCTSAYAAPEKKTAVKIIEVKKENDPIIVIESEPPIQEEPVIEEEPTPVEEKKEELPAEENTGVSLSNAEIDLLALVTMAEAEGESELGKRLVIDTILNRVDSPQFPNSVHGVVHQKGHFSSMWDGRVNQCYIQNSIRNLVIEECRNRTNSQVLYFRTGKYSAYGTPLFKEDHHYFSGR